MRDVQRFRGGLVFKAHRVVYDSTLGLKVIKKEEGERARECVCERGEDRHHHPDVPGDDRRPCECVCEGGRESV